MNKHPLIFGRMNEGYLSLGSNIGDRRNWLRNAISEFDHFGISVVGQSNVFKTAAWGKTDQPDFLNMVIKIQTSLDPTSLLHTILAIEQKLGRLRTEKWGPRIIDIDILFYENIIMDEQELKVPHPYIQDRMFIMKPMAQIAPDYVHPILKQTITQLLDQQSDTGGVNDIGPL